MLLTSRPFYRECYRVLLPQLLDFWLNLFANIVFSVYSFYVSFAFLDYAYDRLPSIGPRLWRYIKRLYIRSVMWALREEVYYVYYEDDDLEYMTNTFFFHRLYTDLHLERGDRYDRRRWRWINARNILGQRFFTGYYQRPRPDWNHQVFFLWVTFPTYIRTYFVHWTDINTRQFNFQRGSGFLWITKPTSPLMSLRLWFSTKNFSSANWQQVVHTISLFQNKLQYRWNLQGRSVTERLVLQWKITFGDGFLYLRGLTVIFFIDACLTDDEPLWEPIEWSLVQSWILFIFLFAWIAENLISSRYGSYTGRDKRVWFSWYKTFWLVEGWYIMSLGAASLWVMVPHYYEVTYSMSFIVSWWNWYSRVFFFKFISMYTIVLFLAYYLQISMRWLNWKKLFTLILLINLFLSYLLYIHFFMTFFGYFTDPNWYSKACWVDYIQLSHEPNKWSWGAAKRDHFSYHNSKTVFWFKNDGPFAGAFLFFNLFFFLSLFLLLFYWVTLMRRVYTTQEVTFTLTTYCISSLKQFFYFFAFIFLFVVISYFFQYTRIPNEFMWGVNAHSWWWNFLGILLDYPYFLWDLTDLHVPENLADAFKWWRYFTSTK